MNAACKTCKWFKSGQGTGLLHRAMIASGNRYHPTSNDIALLRTINKDGACTFNPEPVQKWSSDACGQYAESEPA